MKNEARVCKNENEKEIEEKVIDFIDEVNNRIENCIENRSDIIFQEMESAYINVSNYEPLLVDTYSLPKDVKTKKH